MSELRGESGVTADTLCVDQVDYLYEQLNYSSLGFLLLGLMVVGVLWAEVDGVYLSLWAAAHTLVNGLRWFSSRYYQHVRHTELPVARRWALLFMVGAALSGLIFGLLAFILGSLTTIEYQLFIAVLLAGVTGVSIASMASIWLAYLSFALPLLGGFSLWALFSSSAAGPFLVLIGAVYLAVLMLVSFYQHKQTKRMLLLNRDNASLLMRMEHEHIELSAFKTRIQQEQALAEHVMSSITDLKPLDHLGVRYRVLPCSEFSGDVFLADGLPDGRVRLFLGDITGHGLSAAISAIPIAQTFNSMNRKGKEAEVLLWELNRNLNELLPVGMFCAAVMIDMMPRKEGGCAVRIWNGGMEDALICRPSSGKINYVCSSHLALGILGSDSFSPDFEQFELECGDHIIAYSDGVTEAPNAAGEPFGRERIEDALRGRFADGDGFDGLIETLQQFRGAAEQVDDIMLVSLACSPPGAAADPM